MLTLASIQLKMGDYRAAKSTAEAIVASADAADSTKSEARDIAAVAARSVR